MSWRRNAAHWCWSTSEFFSWLVQGQQTSRPAAVRNNVNLRSCQRVVLTLMSSSGVQRWRLVGRPFNEVLGELSLMSLTVLPVWSADMLLLLSFLLGKLGWRKKKKTGPCWGYRCMNQWVATKKWLLFMNLAPVVFVSNREVKRLALCFTRGPQITL